MQEPPRLNLLQALQKTLRIAEKKGYIHRLIYVGKYKFMSAQDSRYLQLIFESNIKLINDEFPDVSLTGFGLFYDGYFIIILEGPEEGLFKHLQTLMESFKESYSSTQLSNTPTVERVKVLVLSHHIIRRYFFNWFGRPAKPPVLLERIERTNDPEDELRQIHTCIRKLYRMSEYLRNQPIGLIRATLDNISEVCQQFLPEFNLLEFILSSPALHDLNHVLDSYGNVPDVGFLTNCVWPMPTDFVPYNIIGKDKSKQLMYIPQEEGEEKPEIEESQIESEAKPEEAEEEEQKNVT